MTNTLTFTCSICGEPATLICSYCTKDACSNHLCEKCGRCSDCCECEVPLDGPAEPAWNGSEGVVTEQTEVVLSEVISPDTQTAEPAGVTDSQSDAFGGESAEEPAPAAPAEPPPVERTPEVQE